MKKEQSTIEQSKVILTTYLNENSENFRIEKIKTANFELLSSQKNNLHNSLNLGRLISEGLDNFNLPENKQQRKNLGLKISVEYFIEQAYSLTKSWAYKLVKAYNLDESIKTDYFNSGNIDKELSIAGLIKFANPKEETTEDVPNEDVPTEDVPTEDVPTENSDSEQNSFGGVTLTLNKATKEDI